MKKRIIINLLLAFLVLPIIKMVFDYIYLKENGPKMFDGTYLEYEKAYAPNLFFGISPVFLLFILLPYNYFIRKKQRPLLAKILIFELIFIAAICLAGSFYNIWTYPYWENVIYIIKTLPLSCLFASVIHFAVDKNDEHFANKLN